MARGYEKKSKNLWIGRHKRWLAQVAQVGVKRNLGFDYSNPIVCLNQLCSTKPIQSHQDFGKSCGRRYGWNENVDYHGSNFDRFVQFLFYSQSPCSPFPSYPYSGILNIF